MDFGHKSRAITLLFLLALLSDTNVYAKFEENRLKGTKVRARKRSSDGRTDRWMDGHSKFGGYNIIPRHFLCGGV